MIKSEIRQGSVPPINFTYKITPANQDDSWAIIEKRTIDFGPWNASNEFGNEFLDAELSLSKYNRGFLQKNGRTNKKKGMRKHKKRSLSQMSTTQDGKSSSESNSQRMVINEQSKGIGSSSKLQTNKEQDVSEMIKIDSKTINIGYQQGERFTRNIVDEHKKDMQIFNQAKTTFLKPLHEKSSYYRNTRVKKQTEINCSFQGDGMRQVIKTEPSSHLSSSLPHSDIITDGQRQLQKQSTQRRKQVPSQHDSSCLSHSINVSEGRIFEQVTPRKQSLNHYNNKELQHKEDDSDDQNGIQYSKITKQQRKQQNQSKDISTQSHSIDEHNSTLNKDTKPCYSSSSSLLSNECAKNQEYIGANAIASSELKKGCDEYKINSHSKMRENSSQSSTPVVSSPQRVGHLFQISSNHYYQENNAQQQNDTNNYIGRRLKTEDMYQKKGHTNNNQIFYKSFLEQEDMRSSSRQNNIINPSKMQQQNQFQALFAPISNLEDNKFDAEQLHLQQNHLRVSHYQASHPTKNSSSSSQQPIVSNEKATRIILREIVIATNKSNRDINTFSKNIGIEKDNNQKDISQIKNSTIQQRRNILQSCLADSKRQKINNNNNNKIEQQSSFLTSQNSMQQTSYIIKNQSIQFPNVNIISSADSHTSQILLNINSNLFNIEGCNTSNHQDQNNSVIYRKALCSRNQLTFSNNHNANYYLNNSRRSQECIGENTRSLFRGSQNDIYSKQLGGQFSTQNSKARRRSCSPVENFGQKENTKYLQKIIQDSNNNKQKNQSELHQSMLITKSQFNNNAFTTSLPKINPDILPNFIN